MQVFHVYMLYEFLLLFYVLLKLFKWYSTIGSYCAENLRFKLENQFYNQIYHCIYA